MDRARCEEIVRALANGHTGASGEISGDVYCVLCGEDLSFTLVLPSLGNHADDCPWRMAVELVEEADG